MIKCNNYRFYVILYEISYKNEEKREQIHFSPSLERWRGTCGSRRPWNTAEALWNRDGICRRRGAMFLHGWRRSRHSPLSVAATLTASGTMRYLDEYGPMAKGMRRVDNRFFSATIDSSTINAWITHIIEYQDNGKGSSFLCRSFGTKLTFRALRENWKNTFLDGNRSRWQKLIS